MIYMSSTRGFSVYGANFNPFNTKLYFDPPIPESTWAEQKVGRYDVPVDLCRMPFLT